MIRLLGRGLRWFRNRRWVVWLREHPWIASLLLVALVVIPGFVRVEQLNAKQDRADERERMALACIRDVVDQIVARSDALNLPNQVRTDASDELFRSFLTRDQATILDNLNRYINASDKQKDALKQNPIPPRPKFNCPG